MRIVQVVEQEEGLDGCHGLFKRIELVRPNDFLLERPHKSLGVCVPFRVIVAGGDVLDFQDFEDLFVACARRLRAIVAHQVNVLRSAARRTGDFDGLVQCLEPEVRLRSQPERVAQGPLGVPVDNDHQVQPTETLHVELGHVRTPPLVAPSGLRFGAGLGTFRFVALDRY